MHQLKPYKVSSVLKATLSSDNVKLFNGNNPIYWVILAERAIFKESMHVSKVDMGLSPCFGLIHEPYSHIKLISIRRLQNPIGNRHRALIIRKTTA